MGDGERHSQPPKADGGAATLPGVGGALANPESLQAGGVANAETLPAGKAAAPAATTAATTAATAAAVSETVGDSRIAHSETLSGHAATLPGPHTVADLPSLPRVDDSLYSIGAEIARGGMGKILSARDRRLRRDVVIKVMRAGSIDPRFEREALITARLQHPSIVRVYDAGVLGDGRAFYAMERVRGRSLEVVIAEAKTLRERMALLPHAIAVCDAIAYAHSEGVLHRDLKPSNVLIGPFGETVVIDWGLAKEIRTDDDDNGAVKKRASTPLPVPRDDETASADLTQLGAVLGTPSYMAPEQARGEPSDERSDIYALGALLYAMLTGHAPYIGKTTDEVLDAVIAGTHQPIGDREPELPRELAALIDHAMETKASQRISSAKELADELRRFAAGKLLATHQYSLRQLLGRWFWKHRITVGISVFALIVLAVSGVVAVRKIVAERDAAQNEKRNAEVARMETENRRNRDTLQMARQSIDGDPSLAVAWLERLTPDGFGPAAQAIAADAANRGLAFELRGHSADIELVAMSPDHVHVATGSDDGTIRWWNLDSRTSITFEAHTGPIEAITISRDGKWLASAGTDHEVYLWDLTLGTSRHLKGHTKTVRGVAFSPDSKLLASTGEDGRLFIWDVATAQGRSLTNHPAGLRPVIWFDDHNVIAGGFDGSMGRFDALTGKGAMKKEYDAELRCFALSPDRKYLVAGDEDGSVTLWDGTTGAALGTLGHHTDVTRRLIFTPDGKAVISAGGDAHVWVHPIPAGEPLDLAGNGDGVKDIALSSDGQLVAAAGIDGIVRVWTITGKLLNEFHGHFFAVKAVVFTGDGRVVSGSEDDVARVWSLTPPAPPPTGFALKAWLMAHTNVQIARPQNDAARR